MRFWFLLVALLIGQLKHGGQSLWAQTDTLNQWLDSAKAILYDQPDSALQMAQMAEKIAREQNQKEALAYSLAVLGNVNYVISQYDVSIRYYLEAQELFETLNDDIGLSNCLNGIGLIYSTQNRQRDAIIVHKEGIKLAKTKKDTLLLSRHHFNIGLAFEELMELDSALHYFQISLQLSSTQKNNRIELMSYNRLGETYFLMGNYLRAIQYYEKVMKSPFLDQWERTFALAGLAQSHSELGNLDKALNFAQTSLEVAEKMNALWDQKRALEIISNLASKKGDYKRAYETHQSFKHLSDSIYSERKEKEINYLKFQQSEAEKQQLQNENALKANQLEKNKLLIYLFATLALLLLIIVLFFIRIQRIKEKLLAKLQEKNQALLHKQQIIQKQNDALASVNQTKDKLFSIISHDLKGPIFSLEKVMELSEMDLIKEEDRKRLTKDLHKQVTKLSKMLRNLLEWARTQMQGVEVNLGKVNIMQIGNEVCELFEKEAHAKEISIKHEVHQEFLIYADRNHTQIIFQNLLANAIKFTRPGGKINVYYSEETNFINLHIKDNGIGISNSKQKEILDPEGTVLSTSGTENESGTGLGLILIKQFVAKNHGEFNLLSKEGEGAEFIISFQKFKNNL